MVRVTFTRGYRMYQPGETAAFSESEAARLIPAYGYDADGPTPAELQAKAEAEAAEKAKAEAEAAEKAKAEAEAAEKAKAKGKG